MACRCIEEMDAKLGELNTKLSVTMAFPRDGTPAYVLPHLQTEKIEKRQRRGPALAIPTFCPFCGTRYRGELNAAEAAS